VKPFEKEIIMGVHRELRMVSIAGIEVLIGANGNRRWPNFAPDRQSRPGGQQRKNTPFAGHDAGAQNLAMLAQLIETRKLNQVEPHYYLTGALTAIVNGHKQNKTSAAAIELQKLKSRLKSIELIRLNIKFLIQIKYLTHKSIVYIIIQSIKFAAIQYYHYPYRSS